MHIYRVRTACLHYSDTNALLHQTFPHLPHTWHVPGLFVWLIWYSCWWHQYSAADRPGSPHQSHVQLATAAAAAAGSCKPSDSCCCCCCCCETLCRASAKACPQCVTMFAPAWKACHRIAASSVAFGCLLSGHASMDAANFARFGVGTRVCNMCGWWQVG
jgi:hypothetical protein